MGKLGSFNPDTTRNSQYDLLFIIAQRQAQANGGLGCVSIVDTTTVTGVFFSVQMVTDTVFTTLTDTTDTGGPLAGLTIPAGVTLYGNFTSIKLTSGACRAYNAR